MSEYAKLPSNYDTVFTDLMGPDELAYPSVEDLVEDSRETAGHMAAALTTRLEALSASPYEQTFYEVPGSEGCFRVAIIPPENMLDTMSGPKWRVVINEKQHVYIDGRPKEQWDIMDILVKPDDLRLTENHARLRYVVGYGETGPPPGIPPRIVRDLDTFTYSLSKAQGYNIKLPEIPDGISRKHLRYYQKFSYTADTVLKALSGLSEVTRVEAATHSEPDGEL